MSTGLECEFLETNGKWYYILEDYGAPKVSWDWREYATAYGPFRDQENARDHLRDNHANPGGCSVIEYGEEPLDKTLAQLITQARS